MESAPRDTAAERAGLREGDVIVGLDGRPIDDSGQKVARGVSGQLERRLPGIMGWIV
jgi:S1-C subfamily serine protease